MSKRNEKPVTTAANGIKTRDPLMSMMIEGANIAGVKPEQKRSERRRDRRPNRSKGNAPKSE